MLDRLLAVLRLAFWAPSPPRTADELEEARRDIARRIVMRTATGNVRLSKGQYVTREDIDRGHERILGLKFDDV